MAYSLSANLTAKKNDLSSGTWVWLLDMDRDSSNTSYYALYPEDVTFNGQTYTARAGSFEPPETDNSGSIRPMNIVLADPQDTDTAYIRAGKYFDQRMAARYVNLDYLSAEADQKYYRGMIREINSNIQHDQETGKFVWLLQFSAGARDIRLEVVPREKFSRVRCRYRFKTDPRCGYAGAETTCDLTIETCENTMNNVSNFGAFPGIPIRLR
jgi:hypothetical protein